MRHDGWFKNLYVTNLSMNVWDALTSIGYQMKDRTKMSPVVSELNTSASSAVEKGVSKVEVILEGGVADTGRRKLRQTSSVSGSLDNIAAREEIFGRSPTLLPSDEAGCPPSNNTPYGLATAWSGDLDVAVA